MFASSSDLAVLNEAVRNLRAENVELRAAILKLAVIVGKTMALPSGGETWKSERLKLADEIDTLLQQVANL